MRWADPGGFAAITQERFSEDLNKGGGDIKNQRGDELKDASRGIHGG